MAKKSLLKDRMAKGVDEAASSASSAAPSQKVIPPTPAPVQNTVPISQPTATPAPSPLTIRRPKVRRRIWEVFLPKGREKYSLDAPLMESRRKPASTRKRAKKTKRRRLRLHWLTPALIACISAYLLFLIYGAIVTNFRYTPAGTVEPVVYTASDLERRSEYMQAVEYYTQLQTIYRSMIEIEGNAIKDPDNAKSISMGFEKELENIDKVLFRLQGAKYDTGYSSIYAQLYTVGNTLAQFGQAKSSYYMTNCDDADYINAVAAMAALSLDTADFGVAAYTTLTANLESIAESVPGSESGADYAWNPIDEMQAQWGYSVSDQYDHLLMEGIIFNER